MWTRNVLIVAAAGALSAMPLLAQQKAATAPRTVATAVRDTVQSHRVRHHATSAAQPAKADTATKSLKVASSSTAATSHPKHARKHTTKHAAKSASSAKHDSTGTRTASPAKP